MKALATAQTVAQTATEYNTEFVNTMAWIFFIVVALAVAGGALTWGLTAAYYKIYDHFHPTAK